MSPLPPLIRCKIETFDQTNWLCDLRPLHYPAALFTKCPIVESVPGELLDVGDIVLAQPLPDNTAIVLGPYASRPQHPLSSYRYDQAGVHFTSTAYTNYTNLESQIITAVTGYFWIAFTATAIPNTIHDAMGLATIYLDAAQLLPPLSFGCQNALSHQPLCLVIRTNSTYAPGTHTFQVKARNYNAAEDTHILQASLSVWALPM